jgi:hypothetical protein
MPPTFQANLIGLDDSLNMLNKIIFKKRIRLFVNKQNFVVNTRESL